MKKSVLSKLFAIISLLLCTAVMVCSCDDKQPEQPEHTHSFVEGECRCGETDPDYQPAKPGDDNKDEGNVVTDPVYTVTVVDQNGTPLAGAIVQFCVGDLCRLPQFTDASGVATLEVPVDDYTVKVTLEGYVGEASYSFAEGSFELTVTLTQD